MIYLLGTGNVRDEPHTIEFNDKNQSVENFAARTLY